MKIGLLADIHGNAPALEAVLSVLWRHVDRALFAGDLTGYYPFVNECVERWDERKMIGVRGNHDEVLLRCLERGSPPDAAYRASYGGALERSWRSLSQRAASLIRSWPVQRRLVQGSRSIAMCHGAPWDPLDGRVYPDFTQWERFEACPDEVIVLGNTHYPLTKRWRGKLIVNPGSVGQPRDRWAGACFAILDLVSCDVTHHRVAFDPTRVVEDARCHDPNTPYLVDVLSRGGSR